MKVIKLGKTESEKPKKGKCHRCKTTFEYDKSDIQHDSRDGNYIICPNEKCKAFINDTPY